MSGASRSEFRSFQTKLQTVLDCLKSLILFYSWNFLLAFAIYNRHNSHRLHRTWRTRTHGGEGGSLQGVLLYFMIMHVITNYQQPVVAMMINISST